jgi:type VI secretion system protein VasD
MGSTSCTAVTRRNVLVLAGVSLLVPGCGMMREPQTALSFTVTADSTINPNEEGEPSPVLLRIYDLKNTGVFEQATLFELLDDDQGRLGSDLVGRRELEIKPGDSSTFERETSADTRHIGVVAAFRNIDTATWRATAPVEPRSDNRIDIALSSTTVQIEGRRVRFGLF